MAKQPKKIKENQKEPIFVVELYKEGYKVFEVNNPDDLCLTCMLADVIEDLDTLANRDDSQDISLSE